jgi:CTP:molybdopterin cytidylyltransferase MocA
MGSDKARLRLGRRTMLGQVRAMAMASGLPTRIIRRDSVRRCGPLGGISTALQGTRAKVILFLACDMPFVRAELLYLLFRNFVPGKNALFVRQENRIGFPFLLRREVLPKVIGQIERREFSVRALAKALDAATICLPREWLPQLRNVNTPGDWERARRLWPRPAAKAEEVGLIPHTRRGSIGRKSTESERNDFLAASAVAAGHAL